MMGKYCNSLLLLRICTIFLAILLAKDYYLLLKFFTSIWSKLPPLLNQNSVSEAVTNKTLIHWKDIDIKHPPALNSTFTESLRLNELLARPQWKCEKPVKVGKEGSAFIVCFDKKYLDKKESIGEALLISGSTFFEPSFIKSLSPSRWTMFVPEGFDALEQLGNIDVELHYLIDLKDIGDWTFNDITSNLEDRQFDSALLHFYSPYVSGESNQMLEAPKQVQELLRFLRTKQLQIVVEIGESFAHETFFAWYQLLYRIFFDFNYALIAAESDGICSGEVQNCKYRLSFVHFDPAEPVEPPVFGFGSPLEERQRLINYILGNSYKKVSCMGGDSVNTDIPLLCPAENTKTCSLVYVRYRKLHSTKTIKLLEQCQISLFSPMELKEKQSPSVQSFPVGISTKEKEIMRVPANTGEDTWLLIPFSDIIDRIQKEFVDFLLIDLEGGEWDVFPAVLNSAKTLQMIQRISFRLRLWIGEENENFRRFYSYFLRLEENGFRKLASSVENDTTYFIAFERVK